MLQKLSVLLACLLLLNACTQRVSPDSAESVPSSPPPSASTPESQPEPELPASPALSLEEWWSGYLYDAVYRFQSDYDAESPMGASGTIAEYCAVRLISDGKMDSGTKTYYAGGSFDRALVEDYVMRYFHVGLDALDLVKQLSDDGKTLELQFMQAFDPGEKLDGTLTNGAFTLTGQAKNPDGTVALTVTRDDDVLTTFTMAPNGQGGWYFKRVRVDFTAGKTPEQLASVKLSGTYRTAKELNGMDSRRGSGRTWSGGELGGKLLLADAPDQYNPRSILRMSLVSMSDLSEVKTAFQLEKGEYCRTVSADGTRIVALTNQRILTWGPDFSAPQSSAYPEALKALYPGEYPQISFSPDGKLATYANAKGLVLLDLKSGQETLFAEHPDTGEDSNIMAITSYGAPTFLPGGRRISARIYGYESTAGIFVYDLDAKSGQTLAATYGWESFDFIAGNKIIAFQVGGSGDASYCLDLDTGDKTEFTLPPEIKQILPASSGKTMLLLGGLGNYRWQLYRMNLDTLQLEKQEFAFQSADTDPQILGVSESGAVLLNYFSFETGSGEYILAQG